MAKARKRTTRSRPRKPETRFTLGTYEAEVTLDELREAMDWMLLGAGKGYTVQPECLMGEMAPDDFFGWVLAVCQTFLKCGKWDAAFTMRTLAHFSSFDDAVAYVWDHLPKKQPAPEAKA